MGAHAEARRAKACCIRGGGACVKDWSQITRFVVIYKNEGDCILARASANQSSEMHMFRTAMFMFSVVFALSAVSRFASADIPPPGDPAWIKFGIGAMLEVAEPFPVLRNIAPEGPAALAKLKDGDAVLAIDRAYTKGFRTFDELRIMLEGQKDTSVRLVLLRKHNYGETVLVVDLKRTIRVSQ